MPKQRCCFAGCPRIGTHVLIYPEPGEPIFYVCAAHDRSFSVRKERSRMRDGLLKALTSPAAASASEEHRPAGQQQTQKKAEQL